MVKQRALVGSLPVASAGDVEAVRAASDFGLHSCRLNGRRRINPHTNQNYDTATINTSLPLIAALQRADTALIHGEKRQRAGMRH
jgi:hypothetical protein